MKKPVTVFVCSTFADLAEERRRVLDAIRRLQLQHDSMEFFGARSNLPIDTCIQEVRRSDLLVVIVGHRYGSIVPGSDISYSEAEYREGVRLNKPCLVYVRSDDVPILPRNIEREPDKVRLLEQWKQTLHSRHTVATFAAPDELAVQVAADISETLRALDNAAVTTTVPDEIPAAVAALVREALDRGTPEAAVLSAVKNALSSLLVDTGQRKSKVFFSYSHSDATIVRQLAARVEGLGFDVWIDHAKLGLGDSITSGIEEGLGRADYIVFFLSKASLTSRWAREELGAALQRRLADPQGPVIIPVLLDDSPVPPLLRDVMYLDLRDRDIADGASSLIEAVRRQEVDRAARAGVGAVPWDAEAMKKFKARIRATRR